MEVRERERERERETQRRISRERVNRRILTHTSRAHHHARGYSRPSTSAAKPTLSAQKKKKIKEKRLARTEARSGTTAHCSTHAHGGREGGRDDDKCNVRAPAAPQQLRCRCAWVHLEPACRARALLEEPPRHAPSVEVMPARETHHVAAQWLEGEVLKANRARLSANVRRQRLREHISLLRLLVDSSANIALVQAEKLVVSVGRSRLLAQ